MVDTLFRAVVDVAGLSFTIPLHGAQGVSGEECHYRKANGITHVQTRAVYTCIEDAQAAEARLNAYVQLCIEANEYKQRNKGE